MTLGDREDFDQDSFALLGLSRDLDLPRALLESHYQEAMRSCHPDKVPQDQRATAERRAALVARAYQELRSFLPRAQCLLRLRRCGGAPSRTVPPGFLEEVLALNEAVEEGRPIRPELERRVAQRQQAIRTLFSQEGGPAETESQVNALVYEENLLRHLERREEEDP